MTLVLNLVSTVSSAKFICCCWRNPWCDCHVTHTPKCYESAKYGQIINCGLTLLIVCFPCAAYELRHSSDLALLTKWPVFLQNAFGNRAYANQTNLNGKWIKKLGGQAKIWGAWPPLRIASGCRTRCNVHTTWEIQVYRSQLWSQTSRWQVLPRRTEDSVAVTWVHARGLKHAVRRPHVTSDALWEFSNKYHLRFQFIRRFKSAWRASKQVAFERM